MFAHKLSMYLKNDGALAFKHRIEADIIPLLRKQKGFLEEITFLYLNGREVHAFSLWESAEHAEAFNRGTYPEVARMLASVIEGMPRYRPTRSLIRPSPERRCRFRPGVAPGRSSRRAPGYQFRN